MTMSNTPAQERYEDLVSKHDFAGALELADRYELDKDEALKSQWLQSCKGENEINTILPAIKDQGFVISECIVNISPTEGAMKALLSRGLQVTDMYRKNDANAEISSQNLEVLMNRLRLLKFIDRLETYLGLSMGRFSASEYDEFRTNPIDQSAKKLAEDGKLGGLNFLFKRHPYSLSPFMLDVLCFIPETIIVETYKHLLPGRLRPSSIFIREVDWVESEDMISKFCTIHENFKDDEQMRTEFVAKQCRGSIWPSPEELILWYKNRALEIDACTGQLDNCLLLLDLACSKGFPELQQFRDDTRHLFNLIYSSEDYEKISCDFTLQTWDSSTDYEKFSIILTGVNEDNLLKRLQDKGVPFLKEKVKTRFPSEESLIAVWLKTIASDNKLDLCLIAIEEACKEMESGCFFRDENEAIDCALQCIYRCTLTDKWNTMAAILSKLHQGHVRRQPLDVDKKLKLAEGHIEAGRILAFYQVPKPIGFLVEAHSDEKGTKQILRLILSKFVRRQSGRSDTEWANMWRDMQSLREKAFTFLDPEFMLMEFCRGLLKAGKFSLARNYLSGTRSATLSSEKAENLVIQAARDYFFSASSFSSSEIWKAKECLSLLPNNFNVKAEEDIIDAVTEKLPDLGVLLLPVQYRQIQDPLEIVKLAITSNAGTYLRVEELIEVAKLLGLRSPDELSVVEEAIAREAAVSGDLQLAYDLCLALARKGYGAIWDLCAAIARGPALDNMDFNSRKHLLGFALSFCDDDSIGELLSVWKDLNLQGKCASLIHHDVTAHALSICTGDPDLCVMKDAIASVTRSQLSINGTDVDSALNHNRKFQSFADSQLPWLLEMCQRKKVEEAAKNGMNVRSQAMLTILSWLAQNGLAPKDDLIAEFARSIVDPPATEKEDLESCLVLLNLVDAPSGVSIIEEQLKVRTDYQQLCSMMKVGMIYSSLHDAAVEFIEPSRRKTLLLNKFREEHAELHPNQVRNIDESQTTFWRNWKTKLEEKKNVAERSRAVEEIIPGVESSRFISGDSEYIENSIFALIDSLKSNKNHIIGDVLNLAGKYGISREEVLQRFLRAILLSDVWSDDDIVSEIAGFRNEIIQYADSTITCISKVVFPAMDGRKKHRLSIVFNLVSNCCTPPDSDSARFYKVLEQECIRTAFISNLNFKNVADLNGLNLRSFRDEVYSHVDEDTLQALAEMALELLAVRPDPLPEGIVSWLDVYKHYLVCYFSNFESRARESLSVRNTSTSEAFLHCVADLDQNFEFAKKYIMMLSPVDGVESMKLYFKLMVSLFDVHGPIVDDSTWQDCLLVLLNFWLRVTAVMNDVSEGKLCFSSCLTILVNLLVEDILSPSQVWGVIIDYVTRGLTGIPSDEIFTFSRAMVFCGCGFKAVLEILSLSSSQLDDFSPSSFYAASLQDILEKLINDSDANPKLFNLLNSLSKVEDDPEDLLNVRRIVWERLARFSDDLELPSQVRVFVLEVMQHISGKNIKGFSHLLDSNVSQWENWDSALSITDERRDVTDPYGNSGGFTSTLVALRSSQLVSSFNSAPITSEDIESVESAVSCFSKLCESCKETTHTMALASLLEEWDCVFLPKEESQETNDDWGNDNWDDGWETIPEIAPKQKIIHPLHVCWLRLFESMVHLSQVSELLKLLDKASSAPLVSLLEEDEARTLILRVLERDCVVAIELAMLLSYQSLQLDCLNALEEGLRRGNVPDADVSDGDALLILAVNSGVISSIFRDPSYGRVCSFVLYLVGRWCRRWQEVKLGNLEDEKVDWCGRVVVPAVLSELVIAGRSLVAGVLVGMCMHTNPALSLVNVANVSLRRFLEIHKFELEKDELLPAKFEVASSCSKLREKVQDLIQSALGMLH